MGVAMSVFRSPPFAPGGHARRIEEFLTLDVAVLDTARRAGSAGPGRGDAA